ncbi:MAG: hypothetical protein ACRELD_10935, partial [Longimicrobiales bacterium]
VGERAAAMAERLRSAARATVRDPAGTELVASAFDLAMAARRGRLEPTSPSYLHPGRTGLILLVDAEVREPDVVAAGILLDTAAPGLEATVDPDASLSRAAALRDAVPEAPRDTTEDLRLALLEAPAAVRTVAVAEALDRFRHLHLLDSSAWRTLHEWAERAYLPAAELSHPTLARRMRWWCGMFRRRYIRA